MRRGRKSYNIIKSLRNDSLVNFCIENSNTIMINDNFLNYYTEDEALSYYEITKELWIKITHIKVNATVFHHFENVIGLDDESFNKRLKLHQISAIHRNRLRIKTTDSHGMGYYTCNR